MEKDNDSEMAHKHLLASIHHLKQILSNFNPYKDLPDWVDHKIGNAFEELSDVAHYLDSDLDEEEMEKTDKPFHGYNKEKHSRTGGLSEKERKRINRETGSNLKRPVTGKVKPGSKDAKRRKSFCARMSAVKGPTSKDGKLTPKGAALRRWKCSKSLELINKSKEINQAVNQIMGSKKVNEVLPKVDKEKRYKVLEKLREMKKVCKKTHKE
jgi:hypothetical protein